MIVQRVTSNSALVAGMFIPRPAYVMPGDWRDFWKGPDGAGRGYRTLVNFDAFRAMVFGAVIPKNATITQIEWEEFWQARSDRPSLALTNKAADEAYLRSRERTARKP